MPTKFTASKPAKEASAHTLSNHPVLSMTPEEIDAYVDGLNPAEFRSFMRDFVKIVLLNVKPR